MNEEQEKELLREVHAAVVGNPLLGHEGLVSKVDRHEKWISAANVKAAKIVGAAVVIGWIAQIALELIFHK